MDIVYNLGLSTDTPIILQWNPSKADTIGTKNFVRCSEGRVRSQLRHPDSTRVARTLVLARPHCLKP